MNTRQLLFAVLAAAAIVGCGQSDADTEPVKATSGPASASNEPPRPTNAPQPEVVGQGGSGQAQAGKEIAVTGSPTKN